MQWEFIMAVVVAIPIVLLPAVFVWYLNTGGVHTAIREARARRADRKQGIKDTIVRVSVEAKRGGSENGATD